MNLRKLKQPLLREPKFLVEPRYCLLALGADCHTLVWIVASDSQLFVDINALRDISLPECCIEPSKKRDESLLFDVPDLIDTQGHTHSRFQVWTHGGMDGIMMYRIVECLKNGTPLDQNVYEGCAWSALIELTSNSVQNDGEPQQFPDFTRGNWATTKTFDIIS